MKETVVSSARSCMILDARSCLAGGPRTPVSRTWSENWPLPSRCPRPHDDQFLPRKKNPSQVAQVESPTGQPCLVIESDLMAGVGDDDGPGVDLCSWSTVIVNGCLRNLPR